MAEFRWSDVDAWYVNLDSRPDRRDRMEAECARVGLPVSRLPALRPEDVDVPTERIAAMAARPQRGAIGCHFSQQAIIERGATTRRNVLVLEDDVVFCDDLAERMDRCEAFLAGREWDVLTLAGTVHIAPARWHLRGHREGEAPLDWCGCDLDRDAEQTEDPRVLRMYGSWFTYAYVVNGDSAERILGMFADHLPRSIGIDHLFMGLSPRLRVYAYTPGCATQADGASNIGVGGYTKFSAFQSLGPYVFQRRLGDFDPERFGWREAARR